MEQKQDQEMSSLRGYMFKVQVSYGEEIFLKKIPHNLKIVALKGSQISV